MKHDTTIWVNGNRRARSWAGLVLGWVIALAVAGCVSEDKQSLEGDSCTKSADCAGELRCQRLTCVDVSRSVSTTSPIRTTPFPDKRASGDRASGDTVPRLR